MNGGVIPIIVGYAALKVRDGARKIPGWKMPEQPAIARPPPLTEAQVERPTACTKTRNDRIGWASAHRSRIPRRPHPRKTSDTECLHCHECDNHRFFPMPPTDRKIARPRHFHAPS